MVAAQLAPRIGTPNDERGSLPGGDVDEDARDDETWKLIALCRSTQISATC
jgi:hypothetical protein